MQRSPLLFVSIFTALYLSLATPVAILRDNTEFLFYIGIVIAIGAIVVAVHRRVGLSQGALWALSLWGLLHMLGGLLRVDPVLTNNASGYLYSMWLIPNYLKYDNVIHTYGFAVSTWVTWECVRTIGGVKPTLGILTLCALAGMGLGSVNEIIEFAAVLMIPGTNVGGYINTGWDLVANLVGSIAATVLARAMWHEKKARWWPLRHSGK